MNDIDLSSYANWDPIGEMDLDAGTLQGFTGILDGNGYSIKNLTINRPDEVGVGLFAMIGNSSETTGGEVKNLGLENVNIESGGTTGGLAGAAIGNISNCYITGEVISSDNVQSTGGLIANALLCNISNCYTNCTVSGYTYVGGLIGMGQNVTISESYSLGDTKADSVVGGLAGAVMNINIQNSYSTGTIRELRNLNPDYSSAGGLVGSGDLIISNSYSTSKIISNSNSSGIPAITGGLCGIYSGSINNSIWNTETTGQSTAVGDNQGGTESNNKGLTTSEMQDPSNWSGWDTSIWDFSTYPPTFKMYSPIDSPANPGGGTGGGTDPSNPGGGNTGGGGGNTPPVTPEGSIRLQIGADSTVTSVIYVDTSFDLDAFDVDFSSADSCAAAIEDIDEVLSRINTKRSEFGAVINRLSSILESQTTTIQNFTSAQSTIMDADIANESADFVKNQILQQTSSALLAQSQNLHASIVLSLIG